MNVASLENCKELYELSGWIDTVFYQYEDSRIKGEWHLEYSKKAGWWYSGMDAVPAYDAGYLLRKLPKRVKLRIYANGFSVQWQKNGAEFRNRELMFEAETPEDALCKLAIELFKLGVLTKEAICVL